MKNCCIKGRSNRGQRGRCVEETVQRKKCSFGRVQAELVIKSEIKEQL